MLQVTWSILLVVQVGTHNVEVAAQYVFSEAEKLAHLATSHPYLTAVVDREQASGGFNAHFAGVDIASAYQNLTNVMLYISPRQITQDRQPQALLLNSHFDSVFGTTGEMQLQLFKTRPLLISSTYGLCIATS